MIQNIEITKLRPHPDNPRKDLGDLTELAESIKVKGVLQNLTVVPWFSKITGVGADDPKQQKELGYIVVIGHRRLAAAKLAGLTVVPCVISNMSFREQIETMLMENMQRSDLTIWEQAQGFQMMLNFGDSINDISERTGFSESTVRRRVKLLELDADKFKQSVNRGGTLQDYAELEKIESHELKNSVLNKIGTPNFKWELQHAIEKEKSEKNMSILITELKKFATQIDDSNNSLQHVKTYYSSQDPSVTIPEDAETAEYVFVVSKYGYVGLYKKGTNEQQKPSLDPKYQQYCVHGKQFAELAERAYNLRRDFVLGYHGAKKHAKDIMDFLLRALLDSYFDFDVDEFLGMLGIERPAEPEENEPTAYDLIAEEYAVCPERIILLAAYCIANDSAQKKYYTPAGSYTYKHAVNETLDLIYDCLEKLGYEMSDEERALRDGTHELFTCSEELN